MASQPPLPTRLLLTCAAIGVATGLVGAVAGYVSVPVSAVLPIAYGLVLGSHVLPGVVAQDLLRRPWVALITHVLAALVSSAFAPQWLARYLGTALLIGGIQEGVAALARYRHWQRWRFFVSSLLIGVILAVAVGLVFNIGAFVPWAAVVFYATLLLGPSIWTALGLVVTSQLRRAGVARTIRR